ncbi:hypothetical protein A9Q84_19390 [Halobacteriovorax marinus]|uniref:Uncharacterized protein n=1 Tax=Halobacteriovorax marinus TaxID=97084 RepID=A0A1Y5F2J9_9BACT|nr:hypothetical protein A9Q84_19390 [Halobacteriovorax marinus]
MKIAIDFDNTIVDYSELFHKACLLENVTIDKSLSKNEIKIFLKNSNEYEWPKKWIEVQGRCYGELILESGEEGDFLKVFNYFKSQGFEVEIISHKSKKSLCGRFNLRESALKKIKQIGLSEDSIQFFDSFSDKCDYLNRGKFDVVIDDLEEILAESKTINFKILFAHYSKDHFALGSWEMIFDLFNFFKKFNFFPTSMTGLGKSSYILENQDQRYFFKTFINKQRSLRERVSLSLDIRNYANVVFQSDHMLVEEFIEFEKIGHIDQWFCDEYLSFFQKLQERRRDIGFMATHGISNEMSYFANIEGRLIELQGIVSTSLHERVRNIFDQIKVKTSINKKSIPRSLCLPDFFKHNFGRIGNELLIFDYESFGLDDLARTFLNAVHHLGNTLKREEFLMLIDLFDELSIKDQQFWNRVVKFYDLIALEWVLICAKNPENLTKSESLVTIMESNRDQGLDYWSWNKTVVDLINERFSK